MILFLKWSIDSFFIWPTKLIEVIAEIDSFSIAERLLILSTLLMLYIDIWFNPYELMPDWDCNECKCVVFEFMPDCDECELFSAFEGSISSEALLLTLLLLSFELLLSFKFKMLITMPLKK